MASSVGYGKPACQCGIKVPCGVSCNPAVACPNAASGEDMLCNVCRMAHGTDAANEYHRKLDELKSRSMPLLDEYTNKAANS